MIMMDIIMIKINKDKNNKIDKIIIIKAIIKIEEVKITFMNLRKVKICLNRLKINITITIIQIIKLMLHL